MAESPEERIDRELIELLNELRVALPGVQVLFAFLLIVPFTDRFREVDDAIRYVYFGSLLAAAASSALLIAPSSIHRLNFRNRGKEQLLLVSNRLLVGGSAFVALAITGAVFVITELMFGFWPAVLVGIATAAWFGWFWYGLALTMRNRANGEKGQTR